MNALDLAVAQVAARQRSLVHRDQARALGMTHGELSSAMAA